MIFSLLLIFHFIADFYLPNNKIKTITKENNTFIEFNPQGFFAHILIQLLLFLCIFFFYSAVAWFYYVVPIVIIFLTHGIIDICKISLTKRFKQFEPLIYICDQIIHIVILYLVAHYISVNFIACDFFTIDEYLVKTILICILLIKPANTTFQIFFNKFKPPLDKKAMQSEPSNEEKHDESENDIGFESAGATIGALERLLVFVLIVTESITAIGFVIAIKALARYKKLHNTKFGEYFILGTFYSVLYTFLVHFLVKLI